MASFNQQRREFPPLANGQMRPITDADARPQQQQQQPQHQQQQTPLPGQPAVPKPQGSAIPVGEVWVVCEAFTGLEAGSEITIGIDDTTIRIEDRGILQRGKHGGHRATRKLVHPDRGSGKGGFADVTSSLRLAR